MRLGVTQNTRRCTAAFRFQKCGRVGIPNRLRTRCCRAAEREASGAFAGQGRDAPFPNDKLNRTWPECHPRGENHHTQIAIKRCASNVHATCTYSRVFPVQRAHPRNASTSLNPLGQQPALTGKSSHDGPGAESRQVRSSPAGQPPFLAICTPRSPLVWIGKGKCRQDSQIVKIHSGHTTY